LTIESNVHIAKGGGVVGIGGGNDGAFGDWREEGEEERRRGSGRRNGE